MGLKDRFIFTGLVPPEKIPELTNAMDLGCIHRGGRGCAWAIVQGQLAGRPVIAYDIDGNREGMVDGESGCLIPAVE